VAQSDEDSIGVFDPGTRKFVRTISLQPPQDPGFGQMPNGLALAGDGKRLFVTCGGINAVAELDLASEKVTGYFPTSWYPIAVGEKAGTLFVAGSKGYGAQARAEGSAGYKVSGSLGTVQFITPAQQAAKSEHTRRVALNNAWGREELPARPDRAPVPVPERVGEPSVFKHVVFIIKENHTYDIDLGDVPEGNGDPALCMFGEAITPNEHAIARQFVLLDNTYTSGTNSADGHQWTVSAVANSYMEQNFYSAARSYPYDGGDPLAYSPKGFLWNAAVKAGKSVRVYGEFVNKPVIVDSTAATKKAHNWKDLWDDYRAGGGRFQITAQTENAALRPYLHPNYIGFPITVSDQWRADQYLAEFKTFAEKGTLPDLTIMLLPANHTTGAKPGFPTPRAAVADNDLALGRVIEAISHSPFWKETLILVIEDDSQFGLDHVDGHRTLAFCVSPYTRRGEVVSEVYNHTSLIRTMGLVLGLPAMNRFDRTATPMTACFTPEPDVRPYEHKPAGIPLDEMNPPVAALKGLQKQLAQACLKLDWSEVDRADATVVARAVWNLQRPGVAFPSKKFHPNAKDDE
jgi:phospholipase C